MAAENAWKTLLYQNSANKVPQALFLRPKNVYSIAVDSMKCSLINLTVSSLKIIQLKFPIQNNFASLSDLSFLSYFIETLVLCWTINKIIDTRSYVVENESAKQVHRKKIITKWEEEKSISKCNWIEYFENLCISFLYKPVRVKYGQVEYLFLQLRRLFNGIKSRP